MRANSALKTPDALHLAAALQASCDEFWTDDKQLITVASQHLNVMDWAALNTLIIGANGSPLPFKSDNKNA